MRGANQLLVGGASVLALGALGGCGGTSKHVDRPAAHVSPTTRTIEDDAASIFSLAAEDPNSFTSNYKDVPIGVGVSTFGDGELTLQVGYASSKSTPSKIGAIIVAQYAPDSVVYSTQIKPDPDGGWDAWCQDPVDGANANVTLSESEQQSVFLSDGYGIEDPSAAEAVLTSQLGFIRRAINSVRDHLTGTIAELPDPCTADYPPQP